MVMLLMTIIGVTIFTLIHASSDTEQKLLLAKDQQTDARIAMSYIAMRLRQNDIEGAITVQRVLTGGVESDALLIRMGVDDLWIFTERGYDADGNPATFLYECITFDGEPPSVEYTDIAIAEVVSMGFEMVDGMLVYTIEYMYRGGISSLTGYRAIRTQGGL
jgi:hypothetical protein